MRHVQLKVTARLKTFVLLLSSQYQYRVLVRVLGRCRVIKLFSYIHDEREKRVI